MPLGVDRLLALDRLLGDRSDLPALDADIAHRVQFCFGVDDAAAGD